MTNETFTLSGDIEMYNEVKCAYSLLDAALAKYEDLANYEAETDHLEYDINFDLQEHVSNIETARDYLDRFKIGKDWNLPAYAKVPKMTERTRPPRFLNFNNRVLGFIPSNKTMHKHEFTVLVQLGNDQEPQQYVTVLWWPALGNKWHESHYFDTLESASKGMVCRAYGLNFLLGA